MKYNLLLFLYYRNITDGSVMESVNASYCKGFILYRCLLLAVFYMLFHICYGFTGS